MLCVLVQGKTHPEAPIQVNRTSNGQAAHSNQTGVKYKTKHIPIAKRHGQTQEQWPIHQ